MKMLHRAAVALLGILLCAPSAAQPDNPVGKPILAPAGIVPSVGIYCADANGKAQLCPLGSGTAGGAVADVFKSGSLDLTTAGATIAWPVGAGQNVAAWTVANLAGSGAAVIVEGNSAGTGTPVWVPILVASGVDGTLKSTFTTDGGFSVNIAGRTAVRLRVVTAGTGSAATTTNFSVAVRDVGIDKPLPPGTNLIGAVQASTVDTYTPPSPLPATAGTYWDFPVGSGQATLAPTITGLTAAGGVLTASVSDDKGAHYYPVRFLGTAVLPGATTINADGIYSFAAGGHTNLRLTITTAGSGNVTIAANASSVTREVSLAGTGTAATNPIYTALPPAAAKDASLQALGAIESSYTFAPAGGAADSSSAASYTFTAATQLVIRSWYATCPAGTANATTGQGVALTLTGINGGTKLVYIGDGNNGPFAERIAGYSGNAIQGSNTAACTIGAEF